jgi:hypothetical protein
MAAAMRGCNSGGNICLREQKNRLLVHACLLAAWHSVGPAAEPLLLLRSLMRVLRDGILGAGQRQGWAGEVQLRTSTRLLALHRGACPHAGLVICMISRIVQCEIVYMYGVIACNRP